MTHNLLKSLLPYFKNRETQSGFFRAAEITWLFSFFALFWYKSSGGKQGGETESDFSSPSPIYRRLSLQQCKRTFCENFKSVQYNSSFLCEFHWWHSYFLWHDREGFMTFSPPPIMKPRLWYVTTYTRERVRFNLTLKNSPFMESNDSCHMMVRGAVGPG